MKDTFSTNKPLYASNLTQKALLILGLLILFFPLKIQGIATSEISPDVATSGIVSFESYCDEISTSTYYHQVFEGEYPATTTALAYGEGGGNTFCDFFGTTTDFSLLISTSTSNYFWAEICGGSNCMFAPPLVGDFYFYSIKKIDGLWYGDTSCDYYTNFTDCISAGCFWGYYTLFLGGPATGYCVEAPTGECGSGYDDCQNCITQEDCEAEDFCFWYLDTCRYGETACAGTSLQLCENQTDCETAGGYWYDEFCWYSPKPTYFITWEDWYAEHGNYATSTPFINSLASSTTGFFEFFGGFFSTFNNVFNIQDATERGKSLGSVVPLARGYLTIFNDFLGGFPISELFIFFLTFMLVIGVIRLFTRVLPMLKFW